MVDRSIIFIQNIPPKATRESIWSTFLIFGEISDVRLDKPKATCLVEFEEESDAATAIDNMHLSEMFGETIYVSYATKGNLIDRRKAVWEFEAKTGEIQSGDYNIVMPAP